MARLAGLAVPSVKKNSKASRAVALLLFRAPQLHHVVSVDSLGFGRLARPPAPPEAQRVAGRRRVPRVGLQRNAGRGTASRARRAQKPIVPEACPVDSGLAARRDAKQRVAEVIRDLRAALDERCGAEGWRRLSKRLPRPTGARRRRPVGGTSLLKVAARTPFPSAQRRDAERGCGREGDRGAAAPSGQVPAALPNASSAARRSRATGRVGVCGALPVPRSGSRRPDDRLQSLGFEWCRHGLFVEARGYERVCRGSSDFARRPKVVSAPVGCVPHRSPRLRRRA